MHDRVVNKLKTEEEKKLADLQKLNSERQLNRSNTQQER